MFFGERKKQCAGTYKVSGYTREDGTKVDSYWRTCGAKHNGSHSNGSNAKKQKGSLTGAAANINWNKQDDLFSYIYKDREKDKQIKDFVEKNLNPVNEHFQNPITPADKQGRKELESNSNNMHDRYYKLALDFENQKHLNMENSYIKFKDIKNSDFKKFVKYQISDSVVRSQVNDYTNVVIPQYNSELVNSVTNSKNLQNFLKQNFQDIKNGKYHNKGISLKFNNPELALTVGHVTLYNPKIVGDYVYATVIDYYNFKDNIYYPIINRVNKYAYQQQQAGDLTNYLIAFPIRYPVAELLK